MVRVEQLESFVIYKARPPILMPESPKNQKKGQAYAILAPTIEDEFKFLSTEANLRFRYLSKYFIEKRWEVSLFGAGKNIIKPNGNGEIDALLSNYQSGNLANVDGVTSYLETFKGDLLKQFNVLIELNHVTEMILGNPKDKRLVREKVAQWREEVLRAYSTPCVSHYRKTLVIPMELWFTPTEFASAANMLKPAGKNAMGVLLDSLCKLDVIAKFGDILLVNQNVIMRICVPANDQYKASTNPEAYIRKMILAYMQAAKRLKIDPKDEAKAYVVDVKGDRLVVEDKKTMELHKSEEETDTDVVAEKLVTAVGGDMTAMTVDDTKKVKQIAKTVIEKNKVAETDEAPTHTAVDDAPIPNSDVEDLVLAAKMNGTSTASEKRNQVLREKYKDLKIGDTMITDLVSESKQLAIPEVPVFANTINESMRNIRAHRFEQSYRENLMMHHLIAILTHFGSVDPAMFLNKDIQVEDVSTHTDRVIRYIVEFESTDRKRHRFAFKLPKMYKDKYLYLNGQELTITHQKLPFPITKVTADRCQLVTNYNKVFVYRYGSALSPRLVKLKKLLSSGKIQGVTATKGD